MCEAAAAGVASVISAVDTLPVSLPALRNFSSTVSWSSPGTSAADEGPCDTRLPTVFWPVDQALAVAAESET